MNGDRLGPYRVLGELGHGSSATVYLAEAVDGTQDVEPGRRVAVKLLHPQFEAAPNALRRFHQEARVGRALQHENVVRLFDASEVRLDGETRHLLAMEYVEGRTLRALISEEGAQPEGLCRHVGREVARGLSAIHESGAVHRDIKPENVVLTHDEHVKIMDLGVAKFGTESGFLSQSGDFIGSVLYAAPEQFRRHADRLDGRADLYALGLTLYELATGIHPFERGTIEEVMKLQLSEMPRAPGELQPQLTSFFEYVILRLLRKTPAQRFRSAEALGRTLDLAEESSWWRERKRLIRKLSKRTLRRPRIPRETSVHGRDRELERIRGLWDDVTQGSGRVLLLEGEAGIGKSRLVDEFVARLVSADQDLHVLYGAWPSGGPATTAGALSTAYREHFGEEDLEEALVPFLTEAPVLIQPFAALLSGNPLPTRVETLEPGEVDAAFLHVTRALALERPTLVVLEDLQHAAPEGRGVVTTLARGLQDRRVLLVVSTRTGIHEAWAAELARAPQVERMGLGRLRRAEIERLLREAVGSDGVARRLAPRLAAQSDGNPLFLFEILQVLRSRGILARADGTDVWTLRGTLRDAETPPRMRDLVQGRLAVLSTSDREVLDAAAVFGFEFDPALLADVLDRPRLRVLQALGRFERTHHLVRSRGRLCAFDHHVLQESLYAELPEPLRAAYHIAIGEALQSRLAGTGATGQDAVAACDHLLRAGRGEAALRWLDDALDHLEEGHLSARAAELVDRALDAPGLVDRSPRAKLLLRKARHLRLMGRSQEEARVLEEAVCMASPKHDPLLASEAFTQLGEHLRAAGHADRARRFLQQSVTLARRAGSGRAEIEATCGHGAALDDLGRHADAEAVLRRGLEGAHRFGERRLEARARAALGRVMLHRGETAPALEELRGSATLSEVCGGLHEQGLAAAQLGAVLLDLGRYHEARPQLERAQELSEIVGDMTLRAAVLGDLGALSRDVGQLAEARTFFRRSLEIARECGGPQDLGRALVRSGSLELLIGRLGAARVCLEEASARMQEGRHVVGEVHALRALARLADEEERPETSQAFYREALALADRCGAPGEVLATRVAWAAGRFWLDEPEVAEEALGAAEEDGRAACHGNAVVLRRALELALGDDDNEGAVRRALRQPLPPDVRYEAHAMLYVGRGWEEDLETGWRTITALREKVPADAWSDFLRSSRVRRRVARSWEAMHRPVGRGASQ